MDVSERIVQEYLDKKKDYEKLGKIVESILHGVAEDTGVRVMAIEGRVKSEHSLKVKLERKGEKYRSLSDLTDIYGARVICFFSDDVDKIAAAVSKKFRVDGANSVDKRAVLSPDAFGYLSLHFVFSLPQNSGYGAEMESIRFEVQIRSLLQHAWAEMQHDMGYKSAFGTPKNVVREFSRVAGLLEIADKKYCEIRDGVKKNEEEVTKRIGNGTAGDMETDLTTLALYMKYNADIREFTDELAKECGVKTVAEASSDSYLAQLKYLGLNTLGDIDALIKKDGEKAKGLAKRDVLAMGANSLSSTSGLKYLLNAELLRRNSSEKEIADFFKATMNDTARAEKLAENLYSAR